VHDALVHCTVLLEYVSITINGTNGWQHLLHQYDAIITAINLSAGIDENEARARDKDRASVFVHPCVTLPSQTFRAISNVSKGSVATVRR